jgi:hypothetical protein
MSFPLGSVNGLVGQDDKIGMLTDFERAFRFLLKILIGRPDGHGLERDNGLDPVLWSGSGAKFKFRPDLAGE